MLPSPVRPMLWLLLLLFADSFDADFRTGLIALKEGNLDVAQSRLESASKLQPANPRVWLALAQAYWKTNKPAEAQSAAQRAEALTKDPALLHGLAFYYSEIGNHQKATDLLWSAIRQDAHNESYYLEIAQLCFKQQNFNSALEALRAGRKIFPESVQLELATGVAYYGLRRFPEAIDAFLRTIDLDPSPEQPYVFLGRMFDQAEAKLPKIRDVFAAFAKKAPENYLSSFLYAKTFAIDNPAQAETLLRRSISLNPTFPDSHFDLGVLLEGSGGPQRLEEAIREMRRSIELNPNDPVAHYHLARLYDQAGKPAEARAERELHRKLSQP
jgi:tetratricopeptide (TPR) repeat protein